MKKREMGILLIGLGIGLILGMRLGSGSHLSALLPSFLILAGIILLARRRAAQKAI